MIDDIKTLVSKQGASVWVSDSLSSMKTKANAKYSYDNTNYGAVSTLMYGMQWDTALKFIQAYNVGEEGYDTYAISSVGYGNYSSGDSIVNVSSAASCGVLPEFRQKNIYDMAGNVWEWTEEIYNNSNAVFRGGNYCHGSGTVYPAAYRYYNSASHTDPSLGFRIVLYIKT